MLSVVPSNGTYLLWRLNHLALGLTIILLIIPSRVSGVEGWYLLLPPERAEETKNFAELRVWIDKKAPLTEWVHYRAFDRAVDCEQARAAEIAGMKDDIARLRTDARSVRGPDLREAMQGQLDQAVNLSHRLLMSRCIIATDQRLAPKPPAAR